MLKTRQTHFQSRIIDYLTTHETIESNYAPKVAGGSYKQVANLLLRMEKEKLLEKVSRGVYKLGITRSGFQKEIFYKNNTPKVEKELGIAGFTPEEYNLGFKIDNDWRPTRTHYIGDDFLLLIAKQITLIKKHQSIAIPIQQLITKYGWKSENTAHNLKHNLVKILTQEVINSVKFYMEKDNSKNLTHVRIFKLN